MVSSLIFYFLFLSSIVVFTLLIRNKKVYLNIQSTISKKARIIIFVASCLIVSLAQVLVLNFQYPYVGHDFSLVGTRAMSMMLYGLKNGIFAKEWASPLFGGGLLQYANPQWPQYSLLYFFTFLMPLWNAYLLVTFILSIVGFISVYFISRDIFNFDYKVSLTSAIFFSLTGYYIFHLAVGHWAFLYHPLTGLIVWASFSDRFSTFMRIVIVSISFSIIIYGGALQTIFFYTCFTLLGVATMLFKPNKIFIKKCFIILASTSLGFLLSLSKLVASVMLGSSIDRGAEMLISNIFSPIKYIYYAFMYQIPYYLERIFASRTYMYMKYHAIWERDISFPITVYLVIIATLIIYRKSIKEQAYTFWKEDKLKVILFILWTLLYIDMFYSNGITHSLFPILNSVNLHLRLGSVWILPVTFIFSYMLSRFSLASKNKALFFITINVIAFTFFLYKHIDIANYDKEYFASIDISSYDEIWKNIKENPDKYYVENITDESDTAILETFLLESGKLNSSKFPYEPIYGYQLQTFKAKENGSPYKIIDGKYNFTHPNSLIFFTENYPQFTGFDISEKDDLDKFLTFEKVDWKLPKIFFIADMISIISNILVLILTIVYTSIYLLKRNIKECKRK